jgi:hypothetical protein
VNNLIFKFFFNIFFNVLNYIFEIKYSTFFFYRFVAANGWTAIERGKRSTLKNDNKK